MPQCRLRTFSFIKEDFIGRVPVDLERDIIIIPDNFFNKIAEENEQLEKYDAAPVKALDHIQHSCDKATAWAVI